MGLFIVLGDSDANDMWSECEASIDVPRKLSAVFTIRKLTALGRGTVIFVFNFKDDELVFYCLYSDESR